MARTANPFKTMKSSSSGSKMSQDEITTLIRKKAYELWEKRGRKAGHSYDDWLEAERIVRGKLR